MVGADALAAPLEELPATEADAAVTICCRSVLTLGHLASLIPRMVFKVEGAGALGLVPVKKFGQMGCSRVFRRFLLIKLLNL